MGKIDRNWHKPGTRILEGYKKIAEKLYGKNFRRPGEVLKDLRHEMSRRTFNRRWGELKRVGILEDVPKNSKGLRRLLGGNSTKGCRLSLNPPINRHTISIFMYLRQPKSEFPPMKLLLSEEQRAKLSRKQRAKIRRAENKFLRAAWGLFLEDKATGNDYFWA